MCACWVLVKIVPPLESHAAFLRPLVNLPLLPGTREKTWAELHTHSCDLKALMDAGRP